MNAVVYAIIAIAIFIFFSKRKGNSERI